jgi:PAS domain S-box-containing protein
MTGRSNRKHGPEGPVTSLESRVAALTQANRDLQAKVAALEGERQGMLQKASEMERSLRESRQRYQDLMENMNDVIYSIDLAEVLTSVNRAVEAVLGTEPEKMIGTDWRRWVPKEELPNMEATRRRALAGERTVTEAIMRDKGGNEHYVEISAAPTKVGDQIVGTQGIMRDITSRRKAEQAVRESEAMLRAMFNATTESIFLLDRAGTVLVLNETAAKRFGKSVEELVGTKIADVGQDRLPRSVAADRTRRLRRVFRTGQPARFEDERVGRFFDTNAFPVFDTSGVVRQIAVFGKDVTEQKEAQDKVKSLQRQIEFVLGATKTGLDIIDRDFNLRYVDPAWQKTYGPYEGKKCYRYFMNRDRPCPTCGIPKALESKQTIVTDEVLIKEGNRSVQVTTIPFQAENGEWLVAEVNADIAERKELERSLKESEEKYRVVVECAGEAIAVVDEHGVFRFMNTTAGRRLGAHAADLVGKTMWDLFPQDVADHQMAHIRRVIETKKGGSDVTMTEVKGKPRWHNTTVEPLRDSTGRVTAALVVARDIDEFKQAQEELKAYREQMIRAEHLASLGTLSATLAHELTQPLTVIRLSIQNSLKEMEGAACPDTVREDLQEGLDELSNATAIVERFRTFARRSPEKGLRKVTLAEVARKVQRLLTESAQRRRITLDIGGLNDLPPIRARENDLAQLFFALSQNAIQAAAGTKDSHLWIRGQCRDESVELQFRDDCAGIAPENLDRIFDPFFTTKPAGEGTGLGLCVVRRIVSQAGGNLHVESALGRGTVFLVTLPIQGY